MAKKSQQGRMYTFLKKFFLVYEHKFTSNECKNHLNDLRFQDVSFDGFSSYFKNGTTYFYWKHSNKNWVGQWDISWSGKNIVTLHEYLSCECIQVCKCRNFKVLAFFQRITFKWIEWWFIRQAVTNINRYVFGLLFSKIWGLCKNLINWYVIISWILIWKFDCIMFNVCEYIHHWII